ncbi:MAG: hypothetical protein R6W73_01630 [Candidatus Saliniplasma sp.]
MKKRKNKDFLEKYWFIFIAIIYVVLIVSLSFLGYNILKAPVQESPPEDLVKVHVTNEGENPRNMTVKMIDNSLMPIWEHYDATNNITGFGEEMVLPGETVTFETRAHSTYDNFPMKIRVSEIDDSEEVLAEKSVRITIGQSSDNQKEFEIDVK